MTAPAVNPDLPPLADLTLHNVTEHQLVDAMVAALQVTIPEWEPQEGATEIMLIEALALTMGQFVFALNQLPRVVLDGIMSLHGLARNEAVAAFGLVDITVASSTIGTQTLPAGARFRVDADTGVSVVLLAAETVTINPADNVHATIHVVAETPGTQPNGIPAGETALMIDAFTWIESAVTGVGGIAGGGDLESDEWFYPRVGAELQAVSRTLVTDSNFATAALRSNLVGRAAAYGLWDGVGPRGAMPGHVAVAVTAPDGTDTTPETKAALLVTLSAGTVAGLQVHVINFNRVAMNLTVTYTVDPTFAGAAVAVAIETELRAWLNPQTWPLPDRLTSVNQIVLRIGRVPGVADITSITGWVPITDGATLPSIASLTINTV